MSDIADIKIDVDAHLWYKCYYRYALKVRPRQTTREITLFCLFQFIIHTPGSRCYMHFCSRKVTGFAYPTLRRKVNDNVTIFLIVVVAFLFSAVVILFDSD
jgi:hypothetical protein